MEKDKKTSAGSTADLTLRMDFGKDFCGIYLFVHFMPAGIPQKLQNNLLPGTMDDFFPLKIIPP